MTWRTALYICLFRKYFVFHGRATRTEYWRFFLMVVIIEMLGAVGLLVGSSLLHGMAFDHTVMPYVQDVLFLMLLLLLVPLCSASVRRLHDTGRRGRWMLLVLVPVVGPLHLLFMLSQPTQKAYNCYGPYSIILR